MAMSERDVWYQCKSDSDCVLATGICRNPTAVNKKYVKVFQDWAREQTKHRRCQQPTLEMLAIQKRLKVRCRDGRCELYDPLK